MNSISNKKKIFWVGSIGYYYDKPSDILKQIRIDLRKDIILPFQLSYVEKIDKVYTQDEAKTLLDYYAYHVGLISWQEKALYMYYAKFGPKKHNLFEDIEF